MNGVCIDIALPFVVEEEEDEEEEVDVEEVEEVEDDELSSSLL